VTSNSSTTNTLGDGLGWVQRAGFAFALCLPPAAGAALVVHALNAAAVPEPADWAAAAAAVRAAAAEGDIVVFAPGWSQEGRGAFRGLRVVADEDFDLEHLGGAKRVVVVASFDARAPRWLEARSKRARSERFGRLGVTWLDRTDAAPLTDFTARIADAKVTLEPATGPAVSCTFSAGRHDCSERGRAPWRFVGEHRVAIGGRQRRCIWAHPTTGAALRITFPPAPIGRVLSVAHGLADSIARSGASVTLEVLVRDERVVSLTRPPKPGWVRDTVSTASFAGRTEPISFVIRTPADGSRHYCFSAEAIP
jgi:hypothetical protein